MRASIADVGDGLCMSIGIGASALQIDCGTKGKADNALKGLMRIYRGPIDAQALLISHFHADHYNGLVQAFEKGSKPILSVQQVFYPRLPDMESEKKKELWCQFLTMNYRMLGGDTGLGQLDLANVLRKINAVPFRLTPVSQGDRMDVGDVCFDVLWPPRQVNTDVQRSIGQAIESFHKALEEDQVLRKLYNEIAESGLIDVYLKEEASTLEAVHHDQGKDARDRLFGRTTPPSRELPECTRKANYDLRSAANRLSVAITHSSRFVFLGDLEHSELPSVVQHLTSKGMYSFRVLLALHHGTHWHDELERIRCVYSVSSNGRKSHGYKCSGAKHITLWSLNTYDCGDIYLPACSAECGFDCEEVRCGRYMIRVLCALSR